MISSYRVPASSRPPDRKRTRCVLRPYHGRSPARLRGVHYPDRTGKARRPANGFARYNALCGGFTYLGRADFHRGGAVPDQSGGQRLRHPANRIAHHRRGRHDCSRYHHLRRFDYRSSGANLGTAGRVRTHGGGSGLRHDLPGKPGPARQRRIDHRHGIAGQPDPGGRRLHL